MDKIETFKSLGYAYDTVITPNGLPVNLIFIKHGSIALEFNNFLIYIDPVTMFGNDFSKLPKADMIFVTHEHGDHFDKKALDELTDKETVLVTNGRVRELFGKGEVMLPGERKEIQAENFTLTGTPAYNTTEGHLQFHPKDRKDLGFVFNIDGLRIYVAGDTEDIPEMADLKDIDVAFLPVNQPYTMTPAQAVKATETIHPKILYPYHYGQTDLKPLTDRFKGTDIDVRVRQLQ